MITDKVTFTSDTLDILLPTIGSAGDVHPMIALGIALKQRGHHATVITNEFFQRQVRDAGLDFVALGTSREADEAIADPRLWHPTKSFACIVERAIVPNIDRLYNIIRDLQKPNTVVAASALCFGARLAQEKFGIPLASVHLQPAIIRSVVNGGRQGRIPMGPNLPRVVKQALFWLLDKGWADRLLAPPINSFRLSVGVPAVRRILGDYVHSPEMVIGLFPEWFAPIQPDWPHNLHLAGFVLHDDSDRQPVSAEVQRFLAEGPPPVIFTPGSAAATLRNFFRESVEACRLGEYRAMLVTRYPEQLPADLPVGVRHFSYLPFGQILPQCAALVYPGGIGTMAQAIKAGIPHLVVPHGHDQPDNAYRVKRLGLGQSIFPERYKAKRVARILSQLLASSETRSRCAAFANRINSAQALRISCDLIENLGQSRRQGGPAARTMSASPTQQWAVS
jgi:UDP:flavonoid glycosyltransferase YjiC (YdhE family)